MVKWFAVWGVRASDVICVDAHGGDGGGRVYISRTKSEEYQEANQ